MEKLIDIFFADFLRENCPDKFGRLKYTKAVRTIDGGKVVLEIDWHIPYEASISDHFDLIEVLAWIYSKQK